MVVLDDSFYRSFDGPSLVSHDSSPTGQNMTSDPAACAALEEEWRTDLAKVCKTVTICFVETVTIVLTFSC